MISTDGHAAPPMPAYRDYLEHTHHEAFDEYVRGHDQVHAMFESQRADSSRVTPTPLLFDDDLLEDHIERVIRSGAIAGEGDPTRRVELLEREGIVAEVLFPNGIPFQQSFTGGMPDAELQAAGQRAYNRWIADFCAAAPGRFIGQVSVSFGDVDEACREIRKGAEAGLRGVLFPAPAAHDWSDPSYDPIWSLCEELGLPLNSHGGGVGASFPRADVAFERGIALFGRESLWHARRPFWHFVLGGVFDRYPGLTLVFTEQHSDWVPALLRTMDHTARGSLYAASMGKFVEKLPSEYFAEHCFLGASILARAEITMWDEIGDDKLMFGADFPHLEGTYSRTHDYLRACFGDNGRSVGDMVAFLGGTALGVFDLDAAQLRPIADRVGPEIEDLLVPLPDDEFASLAARGDILRPVGA